MPDTDMETPAKPRSARELVLAAQAAIAKAHGTDGQLPDATAKAAVNLLQCYSAPDTMRDDRLDVKKVLVDLLDWDEKRLTKAVQRAAVQAMLTEGKFSQAIEVLSYAAAASGLLDPDRLAKLITDGVDVDNAYAPITSVAALARQLHDTLDRYQPARRLQLLQSLWEQAHDGQWWNHTAGVDRTVSRRRGLRLDDEARENLTERLATVDAFDPDDVVTALRARMLTFSTFTRRQISATTFTNRHLADLARIARDPRSDLDVQVLLSYLPMLSPSQRPASPIVEMVSRLHTMWEEDDHPDGLEQYRAKPDDWSDLYPEASTRRYPYHRDIWKLNGVTLDGAPHWEVLVIPSDAQLRRNADEMGNCTFGYANRCQTGQHVITRLTHGLDGTVYNASATRQGDGSWRVGEINSRFNRGGVDLDVRAGFERLVATLHTPAN